jgi:hypothetical protein
MISLGYGCSTLYQNIRSFDEQNKPDCKQNIYQHINILCGKYTIWLVITKQKTLHDPNEGYGSVFLIPHQSTYYHRNNRYDGQKAISSVDERAVIQ